MTLPPHVAITAVQDNTHITVSRDPVAAGHEILTLQVASRKYGFAEVRLLPGEASRLARALRSATRPGCDPGHSVGEMAGCFEDWHTDPLGDRPMTICAPSEVRLWELQSAYRLGPGDPDEIAAALVREYSHRVAFAVLDAYPLAWSVLVELHGVPPHQVFGGALLAVRDRDGATIAQPAAVDEDDDLVFDDLDAVLDGLLADVVALAPPGSAWHGRRVLDLPSFLNW